MQRASFFGTSRPVLRFRSPKSGNWQRLAKNRGGYHGLCLSREAKARFLEPWETVRSHGASSGRRARPRCARLRLLGRAPCQPLCVRPRSHVTSLAKQGFRRLGAWMCDCGDGWVPPTVPSPGPGGHGPGSTPGRVFRKKTNTVAEATFVVRGICRLLWLSVRKSEQHASSHAIRRYHANTQPARGRCA